MIDDDVLDMADVLDEWARPTTIKTVTVTTADFEKTETVARRTQDCVVQVASAGTIAKLQLDITQRYVRVHSNTAIDFNELVEFNGVDYRVVAPSQWDNYGYCEVIAVQTNEPLK